LFGDFDGVEWVRALPWQLGLINRDKLVDFFLVSLQLPVRILDVPIYRVFRILILNLMNLERRIPFNYKRLICIWIRLNSHSFLYEGLILKFSGIFLSVPHFAH
jgi:hypothetical protein